MNRKEAMRQNEQSDRLEALGFTADEAESLRRISMTLRRWHEMECGIDHGCVERDEETGKTYWLSSVTGKRFSTPDLETGAKKRLAKILSARNERSNRLCNLNVPEPVSTYIQTDPRGAALYIIRPGDVPEDETVDSCYSRGICVY